MPGEVRLPVTMRRVVVEAKGEVSSLTVSEAVIVSVVPTIGGTRWTLEILDSDDRLRELAAAVRLDCQPKSIDDAVHVSAKWRDAVLSAAATLPGRPIGKTADFGSANAGSTPARGTIPPSVENDLRDVVDFLDELSRAYGAWPDLATVRIRRLAAHRVRSYLDRDFVQPERVEIIKALLLLRAPLEVGLEEAIETTLAEAEDDRKAAFEAGRRAGWADRLALSVKVGGGTTFHADLLPDESFDIRLDTVAPGGAGGSSGASATAQAASGGGASSGPASPQGSPGAMR